MKIPSSVSSFSKDVFNGYYSLSELWMHHPVNAKINGITNIDIIKTNYSQP